MNLNNRVALVLGLIVVAGIAYWAYSSFAPKPIETVFSDNQVDFASFGESLSSFKANEAAGQLPVIQSQLANRTDAKSKAVSGLIQFKMRQNAVFEKFQAFVSLPLDEQCTTVESFYDDFSNETSQVVADADSINTASSQAGLNMPVDVSELESDFGFMFGEVDSVWSFCIQVAVSGDDDLEE